MDWRTSFFVVFAEVIHSIAFGTAKRLQPPVAKVSLGE